MERKVAGVLAIIGAAPLLFMALFFFTNADTFIEMGTFFPYLLSNLYTALCGGLSLAGGILILQHKPKLAVLALIGGILGFIGALGAALDLYEIWSINWTACSGFGCIYNFLWVFVPPILSMVGGILGLLLDDLNDDLYKY